MPGDPQDPQSAADAEREFELRRGRRFSPEEAIARMAGPGAMKGASPVSRVQQAEIEIGSWLSAHASDAGGALKVVLHRNLLGSPRLLDNVDQPLVALAGYCQSILESDYLVEEVSREADVEWGRAMGERPHFGTHGRPPHPDDPYTAGSVRQILSELLTLLT